MCFFLWAFGALCRDSGVQLEVRSLQSSNFKAASKTEREENQARPLPISKNLLSIIMHRSQRLLRMLIPTFVRVEFNSSAGYDVNVRA